MNPPLLPALSDLVPMDVAGRADRLRARFDDLEVDALLVSSLTNIRYLTGFTGSAALVLVTTEGLLFVTDARYGEQSSDQLDDAGVSATIEVTSTEQRSIVSAAVDAADVGRLGLEADVVTWSAKRAYADRWFPSIELVATSGAVEGLRVLKDDGELARLEAAAAIADAALAKVRPQLADRPTEAEFGLELDTTMRRLGAEDVSFETIVASGPNGALPHHRAAGRTIVDGDLVVIDFGALVDGYHSDMTRTVMVGEPSAAQQRMFDVVAGSQAAGVDAACREVIDEAGWGEAFLHGTGHGVGLDIHEDPRVGRTSTTSLAVGHVVTVEPGVYLPEHGGVRIEDTVVVTADGCRAITHADKAPAV